MVKMIKTLSPAIFALVILCFFLPWVTVSCGGQRIATFSGIQMVAGTTVEEPQMFGPPKKRKVEAEPLALLAFLSAACGFAISFIRNKKGAILTSITSGMGLIFLLLLKSKLDNEAVRQGEGILQVHYMTGFYLAIIFFLSAIGINLYSILQHKESSLTQTKGKTGYKFCPQCGAKNEFSNEFCAECGTKFS